MRRPISPEPVLEWNPRFILAYLPNGVIGLRVGPVPLLEGVAVLDGLAGMHPAEEVEGLARAPYPFGGDITVDGWSLRSAPDRVQLVSQRYDLSCGELHAEFRLDGPEQILTCRATSFLSRTHPTLALQELDLETDGPADVQLAVRLDTTGLPGRQLARETDLPGQGNPLLDGCVQWETPGAPSTSGAAYRTELVA